MKPDEYSTLMRTFEKVASERGEDLFRVRVQRANHAGDLPAQWATLRGARLEHLAAPESWLSKLADGGGGIFFVIVAHDKAPLEKLGELRIQFPGSETRAQRSALGRGDWDGPSTIEFPAINDSNIAPSRTLPAGTQVATPTLLPQRTLADSAMQEENRQLRDRLERAERAAEIERLDRRHREEMQALESRLTAQAPKGPDPVITMMLEQGKNQMQMFMEMQKTAREDQQRGEERMMKTLEVMAKKPEDPITNALIKSHFEDNSRGTKQMEGMATLTNLLMTSAMQMMTHQVEMTKQLQPATEEMGPVMRIAEKIADAALASKSGPVADPPKQLAGGQPEMVEPTAHVEPDDAKEAWEEVVSSVHAMKPAHEITPALLIALHGDPLKSLMKKHHGDMGDLVREVFGAWVTQDMEPRLKYVQREMVKVEMALVALNIVRPSKALRQHLNEQQAAADAAAARAAQKEAAPPAKPADAPAIVTPPPGVEKPAAQADVAAPVQGKGQPFKKRQKNGTPADSPPAAAHEPAPVETSDAVTA